MPGQKYSNKKIVEEYKPQSQQQEIKENPKSNTKSKVFIVTQQDLLNGQKSTAGVFDSQQKAKDYCAGLDTEGSNYTIAEEELQ